MGRRAEIRLRVGSAKPRLPLGPGRSRDLLNVKVGKVDEPENVATPDLDAMVEALEKEPEARCQEESAIGWREVLGQAPMARLS